MMGRHQREDARGVARTGSVEATGEQVYREWPRGERADLRDRFSELCRRHVARTQRAEPTRIGNGGDQLGRTRRACHRRKDDWMLDAKG